MELSPEQRAALLSLAQSARAQLETELELGLHGLSTPLTARPIAAPRRAPAPAAVAPPAPALQTPQPAPAAIAPHERLQILQSLAAEAAQCTRCVLHEKRTKSVFARGAPDAELVFVGEGPGRDEDLQGLPFVGAAGQLLD